MLPENTGKQTADEPELFFNGKAVKDMTRDELVQALTVAARDLHVKNRRIEELNKRVTRWGGLPG